MIETRPLEVNDFSGGVADFSINAPANTAKKMDNLIVQKNKSLKLREGFSDSKIAVSEKVSELINFNDKELLLPGQNNDIFSNVNDFDIWNDQIFSTVTTSEGSALTPIKTYRDSDDPNLLQTIRAGLPSPTKYFNDDTSAEPRSYIVGVGYEYRYKVGNLEYLDQGPIVTYLFKRPEENPVGPDKPLRLYFYLEEEPYNQIGGVDGPDFQVGIQALENANDNYQLAIYRSLDGDTLLRKIASLTPTQIKTLKNVPRNTGIGLQAEHRIFENGLSDESIGPITNVAYTTGGVPNNDAAPSAKYITIVNNRAYYANFTREEKSGGDSILVEEKTKIRQSQTNDPDSVPGSFNVDVKEEITGMSSIQELPIVFCKNQVFRLEGFFDELGRGAIRPIVIDETAGCVSHKSIVRVNNVLYWCGNDGIYRTDGYKVQKIAKHLDDTYQKDLAYMEGAPIGSAYDANRERVYFAFGESKEEGDFTTYYAKIWVLNLNFPVSENSSFQHIRFLISRLPKTEVFDKEILLTMFKKDLYHRVSNAGIIARHSDETFSDYNYSEATKLTTDSGKRVELSAKTRPIIYNYEGFSTNFGTNKFKKWIPRMDVSVDLETNLDLQPSTVLDNTGIKREVQPLRQGGDFTWGDPSFRWGDPSFKWRGIKKTVVQTRRMKGDKLRASYLSANFTNAEKVVLSSDIIGARCLVTRGNNYELQNVFRLANDEGSSLLVFEVTLLENQKFSLDQIQNAFITIGEIANQNVRPSRYEGLIKDKTLPLIKAPIFSPRINSDGTKNLSSIWILQKDFNFPGVIPDEGIPYVFSIRKIPEGQRLTLLDYTIHYAPISMSNNTFQTGQNAGVKP